VIEGHKSLHLEHYMTEKHKNITSVVNWLVDQGYKIKKSKVYEDARTGLLRVQSDKSILHADLRLYAGTLKKEASPEDMADNAAKKLGLEVEKLEPGNEKATFDMDKEKGLYLPKKDFERELAARAAVLDASLRHMFQANALEWIAAVGGNPLKIADLLLLANQSLDKTLNEYATTDTFHVVFLGEDI